MIKGLCAATLQGPLNPGLADAEVAPPTVGSIFEPYTHKPLRPVPQPPDWGGPWADGLRNSAENFMSKGKVDGVSMLLPKLGLANRRGHSSLNLW